MTLTSGETTVTDVDGLFRFDSLGTGEPDEVVEAIARFELDGYMSSTKVFAGLDDSEWTWQISMIPRAEGQSFDTAFTTPIKLHFEGTGHLTLSPGTLVDASGAAATGDATAYLTMIYTNERIPLRAAPGDFSATQLDGSEGLLESWGMVEVLVVGADGSELSLADGATAQLATPLVFPLAGREVEASLSVGYYWFDETTGQWMENGEAVADGSSSYLGEIDEFGHWNSDIIMETTCVSTGVTHSDGSPYEGVQVEAMGFDYTNYADHYTDATGVAYMLVRRDSVLSVTVYDTDSSELGTTNASTPNTVGDCQSLYDAGLLEEVAAFSL